MEAQSKLLETEATGWIWEVKNSHITVCSGCCFLDSPPLSPMTVFHPLKVQAYSPMALFAF